MFLNFYQLFSNYFKMRYATWGELSVDIPKKLVQVVLTWATQIGPFCWFLSISSTWNRQTELERFQRVFKGSVSIFITEESLACFVLNCLFLFPCCGFQFELNENKPSIFKLFTMNRRTIKLKKFKSRI